MIFVYVHELCVYRLKYSNDFETNKALRYRCDLVVTAEDILNAD